MIVVASYTIYYSPNSHLGIVLANRLLSDVPVDIARGADRVRTERKSQHR